MSLLSSKHYEVKKMTIRDWSLMFGVFVAISSRSDIAIQAHRSFQGLLGLFHQCQRPIIPHHKGFTHVENFPQAVMDMSRWQVYQKIRLSYTRNWNSEKVSKSGVGKFLFGIEHQFQYQYVIQFSLLLLVSIHIFYRGWHWYTLFLSSNKELL